MRLPLHRASQPPDGGGELARFPVVQPHLTDDPFNREKSPKRRKITPAADVPVGDVLRNRICIRFRLDSAHSWMDALSCMWQDMEQNQEDQDESCIFSALGFISQAMCVACGTAALSDQTDDTSPLVCSYCSSVIPESTSNSPHDAEERLILSILEGVISNYVPPTGPLAVRALIFLRRIVLHGRTEAALDYERSPLCKWCSTQLYSSDKAVRAQAAKSLNAFALARDDEHGGMMKKNRQRFCLGLDRMFESADCTVQETCTLAWTQLGIAVSENELEPMLKGLLRQLESSHKPVRDLAVSELRYLCSWFGRTPTELFEPYWRSIAYQIVKHVADRPVVVATIADFFGTTAVKLTLRLQSQALPELLFRKELGPIAKIAEFRGDGDELWPTIVDTTNMMSMLAFWVQLPPSVATLDDMMLRLQELSARFGPANIREVMGSSTVPVLAELFIQLTHRVERIPDHFASISDGIGFASILTIARLVKDQDTQSDEDLVTDFLSRHVLGLTTRLSDVRVFEGMKHLCHWINGIEALEIFIKYLGSGIRTARPQVTSFLLDALCNDGAHAACWKAGVRRAAISCWATLVQNVGDDSVGMLIESTFAVIRKRWDQFGSWEKETCKEMLAWFLVKPDGQNHRACLVEKIAVLPRLNIAELQRSVDSKVDKLRQPLGIMQTMDLFAQRITHENLDVVWVALEDAKEFLVNNQGQLQAPAQGDKSDSAVAHFVRALLDCSAKYSTSDAVLASNCLACIGLVGCLDAHRLGAVAKEAPFVVICSFRSMEEGIDFVMYMLQHVLTRAFLAATNSISQGLIAYAVQMLLKDCGISAAVQQQGGATMKATYEKWKALPEPVRVVLSPLLVSCYHIAPPGRISTTYPIFQAGRTYGNWLRQLLTDLLAKPQNQFGDILYQSLSRAAKGQDLAVAEFLLPYMVVYVVTGTRSTEQDREQITRELQRISQYQPPDEAPSVEREQAKLFYDAVFRVIEYAMLWLRTCLHHEAPAGVGHLEAFLQAFPAEVLSQRALYCRDYARAMFFLEPVAMGAVDERDSAETARRDKAESDMIDIYAQIDDPDCLGGIMAKVGSFVEMDTHRKALLEQKAGRWESATTWYLSDLSAEPDNVEIQARVLKCFLESGHHDALLARVDSMNLAEAPALTVNRVLPMALEAAWASFQWAKLSSLVPMYRGEVSDIFNVGIATALEHLRQHETKRFGSVLDKMMDRVASSMSYSTTSSVQACHDAMLKAHVVVDLRLIGSAGAAHPSGSDSGSSGGSGGSGSGGGQQSQVRRVVATLVRRLDLLEDVSDKRYVLGLQRAAMESMRPIYGNGEISSLWLLSARLARKTGSNSECLQAIAHARRLNDPAAEVENARRQWAWGGRHQAIVDLRTAIDEGGGAGSTGSAAQKWSAQSGVPLAARAGLLLTRWLDASGETSRTALRDQYRELASRYHEWEKSHYFLGRHYKKVLESEQALKPDEQSDVYLTGELARLELENYLRALKYGTKYLHTTLPRILTVWLDLGAQIDQAPDGKAAVSEELRARREAVLESLHKRLVRHVQRLPAFIFYTALPQLVARINHPHRKACHVLDKIILKVVQAYPQQALWSVFGVLTARGAGSKGNQSKRAAERLLQALCAAPGQPAAASGAKLPSLQSMLRRGVGLADELVQVGRKGNYRSNGSTRAVSLKRDMSFGLASQEFPFVVPIGRCLTATLPGRMPGRGGSGSGSVAQSVESVEGETVDNAFASDVITIHSFQDEVLILGSLAQPRKLTMRGSDGRLYDILLKPKDDMRTDQRIMEVNALINQALRKDTEAMRRQLSIRTYAVTPLNEDCGIIEWVLGLKTLREIVRPYYDLRRSQVKPRPPDPMEIVKLLSEAGTGTTPAARRARVFTSQVLPAFPPVLQEWFMRRFPYPAAWFAARLRFTRSAAVMSMVGAVLGLGDRHGENILIDEGSGGVMHVDFNCLFEKGRLFTQPETVPFRLTQNMRAAMGLCDHRGPFRRSSELTLRLLRAQEETLLAVLEAFIHDPTLDLQAEPRGHGRSSKAAPVVRLDPPSVVKNIKRRINGLLLEETIPLGVEGQAWELIKQATDPTNLAAMYIGWAPHW